MIFTIRKFFHFLKLSAKYPKYERECYQKHSNESEHLYATEEKQKNLNRLLFNINQESDKIYKEDTHFLKKEYKKLTPMLNNIIQQIELFQTNYNVTLEELYNHKEELHNQKNTLHQNKEYYLKERSDLYDEKDRAYDELNAAKSNISDWHNSYNKYIYDLDSYKRDRDYAYDKVSTTKSSISAINDDISYCFNKIDKVKNEVKNINHRINQAKEERSEMFRLKESGLNINILQKRKNKVNNEINVITEKLKHIEEEKHNFLEDKYTEHNIKLLKDELRQLPIEQEKFLKNFYSLEIRYPRKKAYFEDGMKAWEKSIK